MGEPTRRQWSSEEIADLARLLDQNRVARDEPIEVRRGGDAAVMRRVIDSILEEKGRGNGIDPEQVRQIAREVSKQVVNEQIHALEQRISKFLTGKEIKDVVLEALSAVGLEADDEHRNITRRRLERVFDDQDRRSKLNKDFVSEFIKAGAGWVFGGITLFLSWLWLSKGGNH